MNHINFKSFDFAEAYCYGVPWDVLTAFAAYIEAGGNINEPDRDGTTALEIASILMATPGPGSATMKSAIKNRAETLHNWLSARGAL
jgi:hypothetical protein